MAGFPDFYFRGCRERNFLTTSKYPKPAHPRAFKPFIPKDCEPVDLDTSISWDKNNDGLDLCISVESKRDDFGNIKHGILKLSYPETMSHLKADGFENQVILNDELDPNSKNQYHGNIRFRKEFFYIELPDGSIGVDKNKLNLACLCFVDSQVDYIRRNAYDPEYTKDF